MSIVTRNDRHAADDGKTPTETTATPFTKGWVPPPRVQVPVSEILAALTPEHRKAVERCLPTVPAKYRSMWLRAVTGKVGPAGAVRAFCYSCCGFEDIKENVNKCKILACPLWHVRPKGKKGDET